MGRAGLNHPLLGGELRPPIPDAPPELPKASEGGPSAPARGVCACMWTKPPEAAEGAGTQPGPRGGAPPPAPAALLVCPHGPRPLPFPGAGARMAAGTRPAAAPRSRANMAQWKKKKGLRKRRGAASQSRSSDSEDGEFEIQAEDDARAQKVGSAGLGYTSEPELRLRAVPGSSPRWGEGTAEDGERSAGQGGQGRTSGLSTCPRTLHTRGPDVRSLGAG